MENFGASDFSVECSLRKKRSIVSRKPHPNLQKFAESDNVYPSPVGPFCNGRPIRNMNFKNTSDEFGSEHKLKKLKLKVGGATRTIHATYMADFGSGGAGGSDVRSTTAKRIDALTTSQILLQQDDVVNNLATLDKGEGVGVQWKNVSGTGYCFSKESSSRVKASGESVPINSESVRKSKRVPKRRVLDVGFNVNDDDEEIRYLGKLNASEAATDYGNEENEAIQGTFMVLGSDQTVNGSSRGKDYRKKSRIEDTYGDNDYLEEADPASDDDFGFNRKRLKKKSLDFVVQELEESTPTTRKRALQSGKMILSGSAASLIDFPDGLHPTPSKKKKEELSEVERQLKRTEALQRRRMQSEKAAREAEAEAIRKILGQDSGRKKREEKLKQQKDEFIRAKSANSLILAPKTVRWIIGSNGTIVTFSEDIGLPSILKSTPCSYPPPREKCAGPNCTNTYKYRDSRLKLPLCSLHCYRAIQEKMQLIIAC